MSISIKNSVASCAFMAFSSFGISAHAETVLQLASLETPQSVWGQAAQLFADGVEEASGGEIKIELALSGTTGTPRETLEALLIGTNDIVMTGIAALGPYDEITSIESYPYLFRDEDHFDAVFSGPVGQEILDEIAKRTGFRLVGVGARGARVVASRFPIHTVEDLAGVKIRVPNIEIFRATWEALGASPTPMSPNEVYSGLQSGIIDATENPLSAHVRAKYYEAVDYVIMTNHVYGTYTFIFDDARFQSLTEQQRSIIQAEAAEAMKWGSEQDRAAEKGYRTQLEGFGVTFIEPDLQAFREKTAHLAAQFPSLVPWIDKVKAVQ